MINKNIRFNNKKGFTLIETLVAITILLLSIVGPMSIAANGLFAAYYGRDQITAYYLAQEGIEYVRNARDAFYLNDYRSNVTEVSSDPLAWLGWNGSVDGLGFYQCFPKTFLNSLIGEGNVPSNLGYGCTIDATKEITTTGAVKNCTSDGCSSLNYDPINHIFSYDGLASSKFTRTISIIPKVNQTGDMNEAIIEVKVSWMSGNSPKSFSLSERIYNWQRE